MSKNIGFISTRFAGQDGVSLKVPNGRRFYGKTAISVIGIAVKVIGILTLVLWFPKLTLGSRRTFGLISGFGGWSKGPFCKRKDSGTCRLPKEHPLPLCRKIQLGHLDPPKLSGNSNALATWNCCY